MVDNLYHLYGAGEDEEIWEPKTLSADLIDPSQLINDPDDEEGEAKGEAIRGVRAGTWTPPLFLMHHTDNAHPFVLIEGMHRYTAAHHEGADTIGAWVAHSSCGVAATDPIGANTSDWQPHE